MFKLASWNVNSLKVRLDQVLEWLDSTQVDVLALQETKLTDDNFPADALIQKGYHVVYSGQKTYNGVAVISKYPLTEVVMDIPASTATYFGGNRFRDSFNKSICT